MKPFTYDLPPDWNPNDWKTRYVAYLPANPNYADEYARAGVIRSAGMAELSKFLAWRTDRREPWVWAPIADVEKVLRGEASGAPDNAAVLEALRQRLALVLARLAPALASVETQILGAQMHLEEAGRCVGVLQDVRKMSGSEPDTNRTETGQLSGLEPATNRRTGTPTPAGRGPTSSQTPRCGETGAL